MSASLAPESATSIKEASEALMEEAGRLEAVGDPAAPILVAMALSARAHYQVSVDATATMGTLVREARKPWTAEELREMTRQIDVRLLRRWTQFNRAGIGIGVALCVALFAGGMAGGYWWGGENVAVSNCVRAPQPAGEAYTCTFWTKYSPARR